MCKGWEIMKGSLDYQRLRLLQVMRTLVSRQQHMRDLTFQQQLPAGNPKVEEDLFI